MQTLIMNNDEKHRLILTDKTKILSKVFQWKKNQKLFILLAYILAIA